MGAWFSIAQLDPLSAEQQNAINVLIDQSRKNAINEIINDANVSDAAAANVAEKAQAEAEAAARKKAEEDAQAEAEAEAEAAARKKAEEDAQAQAEAEATARKKAEENAQRPQGPTEGKCEKEYRDLYNKLISEIEKKDIVNLKFFQGDRINPTALKYFIEKYGFNPNTKTLNINGIDVKIREILRACHPDFNLGLDETGQAHINWIASVLNRLNTYQTPTGVQPERTTETGKARFQREAAAMGQMNAENPLNAPRGVIDERTQVETDEEREERIRREQTERNQREQWYNGQYVQKERAQQAEAEAARAGLAGVEAAAQAQNNAFRRANQAAEQNAMGAVGPMFNRANQQVANAERREANAEGLAGAEAAAQAQNNAFRRANWAAEQNAMGAVGPMFNRANQEVANAERREANAEGLAGENQAVSNADELASEEDTSNNRVGYNSPYYWSNSESPRSPPPPPPPGASGVPIKVEEQASSPRNRQTEQHIPSDLHNSREGLQHLEAAAQTQNNAFRRANQAAEQNAMGAVGPMFNRANQVEADARAQADAQTKEYDGPNSPPQPPPGSGAVAIEPTIDSTSPISKSSTTLPRELKDSKRSRSESSFKNDKLPATKKKDIIKNLYEEKTGQSGKEGEGPANLIRQFVHRPAPGAAVKSELAHAVEPTVPLTPILTGTQGPNVSPEKDRISANTLINNSTSGRKRRYTYKQRKARVVNPPK